MHPIPNTGRSPVPNEGEGPRSSSEVGGRASLPPHIPHDEHAIYRTGRNTTHPDLLGIRLHSPQAGAAGATADSLGAITPAPAAGASPNKRANGEVLRTLKALAEATLQEIRDDLSKAKDVETANKLVYHNYIYFPHPSEEAKLLARHADPQRCKQSIRNLMKLDAPPRNTCPGAASVDRVGGYLDTAGREECKRQP